MFTIVIINQFKKKINQLLAKDFLAEEKFKGSSFIVYVTFDMYQSHYIFLKTLAT